MHAAQEPNHFHPADGDLIAQRLTKLVADEHARVFVAVREGSVVGYLIAYLEERVATPIRRGRRFLEIDQIGVESEHRHQGIGKALLRAAETYARDLRVTILQLNTWSFNERGQEFFTRLGYVPKVLRMIKRVPSEE
jgi:ribosomal protein S18 acetylase RimI-like enzyme